MGNESDNIGVRDFSLMTDLVWSSPNWTTNIFKGRSSSDPSIADSKNKRIVSEMVSKVSFARWTVFRTFIEVARKCNGGFLPTNIKQDWLLFQILPSVRIDHVDVFTALILSCLEGVSEETMLYFPDFPTTPLPILGSDFPHSGCFYYVLDEAQAAGELYKDAFMDLQSRKPRPIFQPIIHNLNVIGMGNNSMKVIVSGTRLCHELFCNLYSTSWGDWNLPWSVEYNNGDFSEKDLQAVYISRYLPPSYLLSRFGKSLQARMYKWLRGRHRFTAYYLEELLKGPWGRNSPAAPHKLLNAYVQRHTSFQPVDRDINLMKQEPDPEAFVVSSFHWEKLGQDTQLLMGLAVSVSVHITKGINPALHHNYETLVEYGIARYIGRTRTILHMPGQVGIEEPLALIGILRYFETQVLHWRELHNHLSEGKGTERNAAIGSMQRTNRGIFFAR